MKTRGPGRSLSTVLLMLSLLSGCAGLSGAGPEAAPGTVRARLAVGEGTVPGAVFSAVSDPGVQFRERIFEATANEEDEGLLSLPPGLYYLSSRAPGGDLYGYYGPNPVQVRAGDVMSITVRGTAGNTRPRLRAGEEGIDGIVLSEGSPLAGATVGFYLDGSSRFRGPPYAEAMTDGQGRFAASLSAGSYYLVVRKRAKGGAPYGPLALGDYFGFYAFNPVTVSSGEGRTVGVGAVEVLRRSGWTKPSVLRTRISGTVVSEKGQPLAGFRAFLHRQPEMLGKPAFVSEKSAHDGSWEIWVEEAGTFYLGARRDIGRARQAGEAVGYYAGSSDRSLRIEKEGEELSGLEIIVKGEVSP